MAANSQTSTFLGGMDRDSSEYMVKEQSYRYAEDIRVITNDNGSTGYIQPRDHIRQYNQVLATNEMILGSVEAKIYDKDYEGGKARDCVVVLTRVNNVNKLRIIVGFEDGQLYCLKDPFINFDLGITSEVTMVSNYESTSVSNIYISDGKTEIKVVNINDNIPNVTTAEQFDIHPNSNLTQPIFVEYCEGVLLAGKVQYTYMLFHKNGTRTALSPLSNIIPITNYSTDSNSILGLPTDDISKQGCTISIKVGEEVKSFDYIRIYRVTYTNDSSVPTINIILEQKIVGNEITYNDSGRSSISTVPNEEFSNIIGNSFSAQIIEKHGDRLFSANLKDLTFDIEDYDARAFRCDKYRSVQLQDSANGTISGTLRSDGSINGNYPSEDHDCINPSNILIGLDDGQKYVYGVDSNNNLYLGGTGKNVSYKFVFTEVILSDEQAETNKPATTNKLSVKQVNNTRRYYRLDDGTTSKTVTKKTIPNYSDPATCVDCTGYQRDEVYSFGIVFYNSKSQPSPVHWIADIKMPSQYASYDVSTVPRDYIDPYHCGRYSKLLNKTVDLVGYALGLEFEVKNLPKNVVAYEIVRCDRTKADRTVLTQGILSNTWNPSKTIYPTALGNIGLLPHPWPYTQRRSDQGINSTMDEDNLQRIRWWILKEEHDTNQAVATRSKNIYELICPEGSFAPESSVDYVTSNNVKVIGYTASYSGYRSNDLPEDLKTGHNKKEASATFTLGYWKYTKTLNNINQNKNVGNAAYLEGVSTSQYASDHRPGLSDIYYKDVGAMLGEYGQIAANTMKYYYFAKPIRDTGNKLYRIEDCIATRIDGFDPGVDIQESSVVTSYTQQISNSLYLNISYFDDGSDKWSYSKHGRSLIVALSRLSGNSDTAPISQYIDYPANNIDGQTFGKANTAALCNIYNTAVNQYGGNTYNARRSRIYISTGCYNLAGTTTCTCYGGDTYLCVFDHLTTSIYQHRNDVLSYADRNKTINSYIPLETIYNLNLRSDQSYSNLIDIQPATAWLIQDNPVAHTNYIQDKPLYRYNDAYSADGTSLSYVESGLYDESHKQYNNRVHASEQKTSDEIIDSWSDFKFANYIDVDFNHGELTNIKSFGNKLFYWTDSSVGVLSVNDRSLITDSSGAELVLGTGGVLPRYDTIITKNGSSIINDKSIVTTDAQLYWYDYDKNEICSYGDGFKIISKQKQVQSDLNSLTQDERKDIKENKIPVSLYDKKYNEVWIKVKDKPLIYNENLQAFTSYYNHDFDRQVTFSDRITTFKDSKLNYIHDLYQNDNRQPYDRICTMQFIVNKDAQNTKVFDNVWFTGELEQNDIVTDVHFDTKTQQSLSLDQSKIENREDNYRFYIPREDVSAEQTKESKSFLGRMRGKYLVCNYTFNCNGDKEFKIPYISTTYRYSML